MDNNNKVAQAVETLTEALRADKDLYFAYQSNIAMSMYDEMLSAGLDSGGEISIHEVANKGAVRFLELWLTPIPRRVEPQSELGQLKYKGKVE